jgi:hypothetical protein
MTSLKWGYLKKNIWLHTMLHNAESIFWQFVADYLGEFETEFKNILGC